MSELQARIEQLFTREELASLAQEMLGRSSKEIEGLTTVALLADWLTKRCVAEGQECALAESVLLTKPHCDGAEQLRRLAANGPHHGQWEAGSEVGPYRIQRVLGRGSNGWVVVGERTTADKKREQRRLKILSGGGTTHPRCVQRTLTLWRHASLANHVGLQQQAEVVEYDGCKCLVSAYVAGQSLSAHIERVGALSPEEATVLIRLICSAVSCLHERNLAHGSICAHNILVWRDGDEQLQVQVQDPGTDRLTNSAAVSGEPHLNYLAPERLQGGPASPQADVYAIGVLMYQMLTEHTPNRGSALAKAQAMPGSPNGIAAAGAVSEELDEFLSELMSAAPGDRPRNAAEALAALERLMTRKSQRPPMPEHMVTEYVEQLLASPTDSKLAISLEAAVEDGLPPQRTAEAFLKAAEKIEADDADADATKYSLTSRAARLQRGAGLLEQAAESYAALVAMAPQDQVATTALEDVRRQLGQHEELIETWLVQTEDADQAPERAAAWEKIARLYDEALGDPAQSVVAYTQAFCETPTTELALALERLAGTNTDSWNEIIDACATAAEDRALLDDRCALLNQMATWYLRYQSRSDLGLQCYQAVLAADAANETAMDGMALIFTKAQQWEELAELYLHRANSAATPAAARDLRAQAADLYATRLNDLPNAREMLEAILDQDPSHRATNEALAKLYRSASDFEAYAKLLETRAEVTEGGDRLSLLCKAAGTYEAHLNSPDEALALYQAVANEDPAHMGALRGLDRLFGVLGQHGELLANLRDQLQAAATPRQKLDLYERIGALHEEEFLSPVKAAEAYEAMLEIEPKHESALSNLARNYSRRERYAELAGIQKRLAELVEEPSQKVQLYLELAQNLKDRVHTPKRAIKAYEAIVALDPQNATALEALGVLRQEMGDAAEALKAIGALADASPEPELKFDKNVEAARLHDERGESDLAASRYQAAISVAVNHPDHAELQDKRASVAGRLRQLHLDKGNVQACLELLQMETGRSEKGVQRAALLAEHAYIANDRLEDAKLAEELSRKALEQDRSCGLALEVLATCCAKAHRYREASSFYERLVPRLDRMADEKATSLLFGYADSLLKSGSAEAAAAPLMQLRSRAPDDLELLRKTAAAAFKHGIPATAQKLYYELIERFAEQLPQDELMDAHLRHAESVLSGGDAARATTLLQEVIQLEPSSSAPLEALIRCYQKQEAWEQVWLTQERLLKLAQGDERVEVLSAMGELAASHLDDRTRATKSFVAALEGRPDDRKLLTRLMQLYSQERDWRKLLDVITKLAEFQEEPTQKAKYLMTAGMVNARELDNPVRALELFKAVRQLDPDLTKALTESIKLNRQLGQLEEAAELLEQKAGYARDDDDEVMLLDTLESLVQIYLELDRTPDAIEALEVAHDLAPKNEKVREQLAGLYNDNAVDYLDRAVQLHTRVLQADPYHSRTYKALRKLYTKNKNADGAWTLCQAQYVLNLAEPDEERFFTRMRSEEPAHATAALTHASWELITSSQLDPTLTSIFALLEPILIEHEGRPTEALGFQASAKVDLAQHPSSVGPMMHYAAGVMGMPPPPVFQNVSDPAGLVHVRSNPPATSLGGGVLTPAIPQQVLAFLCGQHLAYYRQGFYTRQLLGTPSRLKAWLFGAIKLISASYPIPADLTDSVETLSRTLGASLSPSKKDELAGLISELLQEPSKLDLNRWASEVDFTADRVGFLLSHDLERAVDAVGGDDDINRPATPRRIKELVLFAISEQYLQLRRKLGINLG